MTTRPTLCPNNIPKLLLHLYRDEQETGWEIAHYTARGEDVLTTPSGDEHILNFIGDGAFTSAFLIEGTQVVVAYVKHIKRRFNDLSKSINALVWKESCSPHIPAVYYLGEAPAGRLYGMPYYECPVREGKHPGPASQMKILQRLRAAATNEASKARTDALYATNQRKLLLQKAEASSLPTSLVSTLKAIDKHAASLMSAGFFEFQARNLAVAPGTNTLVLLDTIFDAKVQEGLRANGSAAPWWEQALEGAGVEMTDEKMRPNAPAPRLRYAFQMVEKADLSPMQKEWVQRILVRIVGATFLSPVYIKSLLITRFPSGRIDLETLFSEEPRFSRSSPADPYIPWLAKKLLTQPGDHLAVSRYLDSFLKICTWAAENKIDLNKYTAEQALDASHDYVSKAERKARLMDDPENPVVYRFPDGYHVRELHTPAALRSDGEMVQNCLRHGNYADTVANGEHILYSLRDASGMSHVDILYRTRSDDAEDEEAKPFVEQVLGKQNTKPDAAYLPYLEEFIRRSPVLQGDVEGLVRLGLPFLDLSHRDLRKAHLQGENLQGALLEGSDLTGAFLSDADLKNANLQAANLTDADLRMAHAIKADLTKANLTRALLADATFTRATLVQTVLKGASLSGARLRYTDLTHADLTGAYLQDADLTRANLMGANLTGASLLGACLVLADLTGADLTGVIWDDTTEWPENFTPPPRSNPRRTRR